MTTIWDSLEYGVPRDEQSTAKATNPLSKYQIAPYQHTPTFGGSGRLDSGGSTTSDCRDIPSDALTNCGAVVGRHEEVIARQRQSGGATQPRDQVGVYSHSCGGVVFAHDIAWAT